jgi:hypothetical protein
VQRNFPVSIRLIHICSVHHQKHYHVRVPVDEQISDSTHASYSYLET